jgi:Raf kinase inhibitor-like YbhB/YbcL family protein
MVLAIVTAAACSVIAVSGQQPVAKLTLQSTAFADGQPIPLTYSGYGDYKSPPLSWSGVPKGTRELALILHDPDVPLDRFGVHWVFYNIPVAAKGLPVGLPTTPTLTAPATLKGATQGINALKRVGYLPPRPFAGSGLHHYTFTLYALDADLPLEEGLTKDALLAAMKDHIIGEGSLVGLFEREDR